MSIDIVGQLRDIISFFNNRNWGFLNICVPFWLFMIKMFACIVYDAISPLFPHVWWYGDSVFTFVVDLGDVSPPPPGFVSDCAASKPRPLPRPRPVLVIILFLKKLRNNHFLRAFYLELRNEDGDDMFISGITNTIQKVLFLVGHIKQ